MWPSTLGIMWLFYSVNQDLRKHSLPSLYSEFARTGPSPSLFLSRRYFRSNLSPLDCLTYFPPPSKVEFPQRPLFSSSLRFSFFYSVAGVSVTQSSSFLSQFILPLFPKMEQGRRTPFLPPPFLFVDVSAPLHKDPPLVLPPHALV